MSQRIKTQDPTGNTYKVLEALEQVLEERKTASADTSYVSSLYSKGLDKILEKITEEAGETVEAAQEGDKEHLIYEIADLWFHCLVLLAQQGLSHEQVLAELARRFGLSGIDEKASRTQ